MKVFILFSMLFFSACSVKEYKLFQEENFQNISEPQELNITYSSKIVPNDILIIDIFNMNKKSNIMVSDSGASSAPDNDYVVYPDGTIILPLLNTLKVEGLTIRELSNILTSMYREYLNAPYVKVNIKNHKIFVLGEVEKRGVVPMEGETISVIEALARAGGLTNHAMRSHVRVISNENGRYIMSTLNLSQFSTLNSRNLMLTNNSIVYVEPKGTKAVNVTINDYLPIMRLITSVLGTYLTIDYLKK